MATYRLLVTTFATTLVLAACKPITVPPAMNSSGTVLPPGTVNSADGDEGPDVLPPQQVDGQPWSDDDAARPKPAASSAYVPFTQAAYDAAKASGQPTMLYFYATWCPICARQEPIIVDLFQGGEIADYGITALRVNFNDPDTDAAERALAEQFGISYQHTFVLLDANGAVKAKFTGHQTKEQLKAALEKVKIEK